MAEREKSALYPAVTWEECIDFIKNIDTFKQKTVAYKAVAELYGLTSVTTKSFTKKVGTAKQFGLITTSSSTIQLTEIAKKILYPVSNDIREVELECFRLPPLYNALINDYDGKQVPDQKLLSNVLMNNYKISKAAKDSAAKIFLVNCEQFNLIKAGVLCYSEGLEKERLLIDEYEQVTENETEKANKETIVPVSVTEKLATNQENEYIVQTYPVESGKVAKIVIPIDSTEDDLYAIRDLLEVIMKRKFKIKIQN